MRRLTVLICTHDRADLLMRTLRTLNAASRPRDWQVDVLIAANACSDETHARLTSYAYQPDAARQLPVVWFADPVTGKSHALNAALPRVASEIVAFVDDDHRVDANYLEAICRAAEAFPEADLFCGRILPDWDGTEPAWVHDTGPYRVYPLPVPRFDQGDTDRELTPDMAVPGGGNLVVRTPWLSKVGAFAVDMGPSGHNLGGAEDLDWVLRAMRLGARLRYMPDMVQYHYVDARRLTLGYLMKKAYKRTASTVRLDTQGIVDRVPMYLYRKIAEYGIKAGTAIGTARRRFYLVRSAAALGELVGHVQLRRHASATVAARGTRD